VPKSTSCAFSENQGFSDLKYSVSEKILSLGQIFPELFFLWQTASNIS